MSLQIQQMRGSTDTANHHFQDAKLLIPLLFRQYVANAGSDRTFSMPSSSKKNSFSGKSLASLAFEALEAGLGLACSKFSLEEIAEIANEMLDEMGRIASDEGSAVAFSQGHSQSQNDANTKISLCVLRLQKEFDKYEAQADYDQAKQIICLISPYIGVLHNEMLTQHLVTSFLDFLLWL